MFTSRVRFPWLSGVLFGLLALPAYAFGVRSVSISEPTGDSLASTHSSNIHFTVSEQTVDSWNRRSSSAGQVILAQGDFSGGFGSSTPGVLGGGPAGVAVYESGWGTGSGTQGSNYQTSTIQSSAPTRVDTSGTQGGSYQGGNYQSTIIQSSAPTRVGHVESAEQLCRAGHRGPRRFLRRIFYSWHLRRRSGWRCGLR